jgi:pilus assembly protein Flp/PilA
VNFGKNRSIRPTTEITDPLGEKVQMKDALLKISSKMRILLDEEGQDLVEYALVVALIGFSATAAMSSVAIAVSSAFTTVSTTLSSYIT